MTFGQLKFRMLKQFPGLDVDVLEGFISDRYGEVLAALSWSRLTTMAILRTVAPYTTGSVVVTNGDPNVTLTGGVWSSGMTGRAFRGTGRDEFYEFTYNTATTGVLDRPYEGPSGLLTGYSIYQSIYAMPDDCRLLPDDAFGSMVSGEMRRFSRTQFKLSFPWRASVGTPTYWASYMDDSSTPPRMQVELAPIPDQAIGIPFEYIAEAPGPSSSSAAFAAWMEPASALVLGVEARCKAHFKDYNGATLARTDAERALTLMQGNEARREGGLQMRLQSHFTDHRRRRCR